MRSTARASQSGKAKNMKKRRAFTLTLLTLLLVVCIPIGLLGREYRHKQANWYLIAAIKDDDTDTSLATLKAGADPNARDHSDDQDDQTLTFGERMMQLLNSV